MRTVFFSRGNSNKVKIIYEKSVRLDDDDEKHKLDEMYLK